MCEITSKVQCQDCLLHWEISIIYCTCGTCLRPPQKNRKLNKDRFDVLSIRNYVYKRDRLMELGTDQLRVNEFISKLTIHSGKQRNMAQNHLDRFLNSPRYRDSQTKTRWDEHICAAYDVIASEDYSYIATRWERSRNENSWIC